VKAALGINEGMAFDAESGFLLCFDPHWTPMIMVVRIIAFGPSNKPVRMAGVNVDWLTELLERIRNADLRKLGSRVYEDKESWDWRLLGTIILTGRRESYDDRDRSNLRELNRSLQDIKIEVRSYDLLIDACRLLG
jgi:hypothetical protein